MSQEREFNALRTHLNRPLHLEFKDGEVVEVILLGTDPVRDRDLSYEVTRIVKDAEPRARGTQIGGTCVARLDELKAWHTLGEGGVSD